MGSLYRENRNLCNKFISLLEQSAKKMESSNDGALCKILLNIVFSEGKNAGSWVFYLKSSDIVVEEVGNKLIFCTKLKEVKREFKFINLNPNSNQTPEDIAFELLQRNTTIFISKLIKDYMCSIPSLEMKYKDLSEEEIQKMMSRGSIDIGSLKGFSVYRGLVSGVDNIQNSDIDISLIPSIFKQMKNRDVIPLGYYNDDSQSFYLPRQPYSFYGKELNTNSVFENKGQYNPIELSKLASHAQSMIFTRIPYSYWVVVDVKSSVIDRKRVLSINYEI